MLLRNINMAINYNRWKPISLNPKSLLISHLFFADDIILASKITTTSRHTIIDQLDQFTHISGQKINFEKSKVFFSKYVKSADKVFVLTFFNMMEDKSFEKYLGFPIFSTKPTKQDFQFIVDNLKNILAGWKTNHLLLAGRTTLIKQLLILSPII